MSIDKAIVLVPSDGVILLALALGLILLLKPSLLIRRVLAPLFPRVLFCGDPSRPQLAITIDDGPSGPGSWQLLTLLDELQVPATLFLISGHLERTRPGFVREAVAAGHRIGHHMAEDRISAHLDAETFREQFEEAVRQLRQAAGTPRLDLRWFRPGGGWFSSTMLGTIGEKGFRLVLGSVFPWDTLHPPARYLRWFVLNNAHPGGILVLHDRPDTIAATLSTLRAVVPELQRRGYRFTTLDAMVEDSGGRIRTCR